MGGFMSIEATALRTGTATSRMGMPDSPGMGMPHSAGTADSPGTVLAAMVASPGLVAEGRTVAGAGTAVVPAAVAGTAAVADVAGLVEADWSRR
jgi:hypothetical protein